MPSFRCCELAVYDVLGYDALYDRVARNPGALARFDPATFRALSGIFLSMLAVIILS